MSEAGGERKHLPEAGESAPMRAAPSGSDGSPGTIRRRLFAPLMVLVLLLIGGFAAVLLHVQKRDLDQDSLEKLLLVSSRLEGILEEQSGSLSALEEVLLCDSDLIDALRAQDRDRLLAAYEPLFTQLRVDHGVTHFSFQRPDRVNLLRVHSPRDSGDRIDRFTTLEAERTGQTASGIELGLLGTFTMRVVRPVFDGDTLIGYLELGMDIEDALDDISEEHGLELAVSIHKDRLDRTQWEAGMEMLGRECDWDRFTDHVISYSSLPGFPVEVDRFVPEASHLHANSTADAEFGGRSWRVMAAPLLDASGAEVGDLIILYDVSAAKAAFRRLLVLSVGGAFVLLTALLGFLFFLLRRTDRDIQVRQKELARKDARFRTLYESTGDAIMTLDETGFTDCNPMALMMFGCTTKEEFCSLHPADLSPAVQPDGQDSMTAAGEKIAVAMKMGRYRFEWVHRRHDTGDCFPAEVLLSAMELDDREILQATVRDITERRRTEDVLRERDEVLAAISESTQDAIVMIDSKGMVTHWNSAAERIFGYTREEALGRVLHDFLPTETMRSAHYGAFPGFVASGQGAAVGQTLELSGLHKDGTEVPVELSLSAARLRDKWYAVGIMRDITERKRVENELRQANESLERQTALANSMAAEARKANAAKSEFLANMSHEIRTPMNGVIGMTGLLLDTELTSEQRMYAETVRNSGDSLLGLINDILDFSKIEAGKLEMETLDFDLRTTLENFGDALAMRAHDKGLEFNCLTHPDVPSLLRGDPGRLRQALMNLSGNSIKFTEKGEIAVVTELVSEDDEHATLRFSVRDTGIGIPKDRQEALFEAFTQVDGSTTRKYGGTGLGLTISKLLAELMGGEIGVESVEGEGSTFWFTATFAKQPPDARPAVSLPRDVLVRLEGLRVLAVDDNETNRLVVGGLLESWRFRHDEVTDGRAALEKLRAAVEQGDPYLLAILDKLMPGMDGEELGKQIKADPDLRETHLILMTSFGKRGDAARMEEIGFEGYLPKPLKQSILFDCLAIILTGKTREKAEGRKTLVTRHSIAESKRANARILLAEDNITNQQVALGILRKLGLSADAVADGAEAVKALESIPYALVLMDCQMPEMDGFEATARIREADSGVLNHDIPIIAMTAHAMQGDREKCLKAGMNDYLSKPVHPQALAQMLDKWLPQEKDEGQGTREVKVAETADGTGTRSGAVSITVPVFDQVSLMVRVMEDADLAKNIMELFLEDIPKRIEMLKRFLDAGDASGVERQAHSIKGASANVSGEALRAVAFEMEKAGKAGDLDAARGLMTRLEEQLEKLIEAMGKE
jgi:PAS domain S-box-containing protein